MTRSAMISNMSCIQGVLLAAGCAMLLVMTLSTGAYARSSPNNRSTEPSLEYYVHVQVGTPYTATLLPALDSNSTASFGDMELFAFNLTQSSDTASKLLGSVRGFTVQTSSTSADANVEVEVVSYNDGSVNGTLIFQGLLTNPVNELAILGGTGAFRGVRGYVTVSMVTSSLFHHQLFFL